MMKANIILVILFLSMAMCCPAVVAQQQAALYTQTNYLLNTARVSRYKNTLAWPASPVLLPCKPLIMPAIGYNYNSALKHGISLGVKMVNAARGSDCSTSLGSLAYLAGTSYMLSGGYYPATRSGDFAFSGGYRFLFLFAEASAGYTVSNGQGLPGHFMHIGPSLGLDLLYAHINLGYSFRTEKINNKSGTFTLSLVFCPPLSLNGNKNIKTARPVINTTPAERDSLMQQLKNN